MKKQRKAMRVMSNSQASLAVRRYIIDIDPKGNRSR